MRAVVQRVKRAEVRIMTDGGRVSGSIGPGLMVLLGVAPTDGERELTWMEDKLKNLRIFEDEQGKMNLSVTDTQGQILLVSQFTLYGDASKGRRPSFIGAARPEIAEPLYAKLAERLNAQTGVFGAHMEVDLINDGPVTLILDTP